MKILQLQSQNVKRVREVNITPDGALVVISGKNGEGKSSILDSIVYALGGGTALKNTPDPIRHGEKRAKVVLETEELIITRTFTPNGTKLEVTPKSGVPIASPQAFLDNLIGKISFDPLRFTQLDAKAQVKMLLEAAKCDINPDEIDKKKKELFDERTVINRLVKSAKARLDAIPVPVPGLKKVDLQETISEIRSLEERRKEYDQYCQEISGLQREFSSCKNEIVRLKELLAAEEARLTEIQESGINLKAFIEGFDVPSEEDIQDLNDRLAQSESINTKVAQAEEYAKAKSELDTHQAKADELTAHIEGLESSKVDALQNAKLPVKGLAFDENGVTFKGIPFTQCSSAEQLKISLAIAMAANPELRVIIIRDGSLLDSDNFEVIRKMAEHYDYQVWVEVVDDSSKASFVIEDGAVAETTLKPKRAINKVMEEANV